MKDNLDFLFNSIFKIGILLVILSTLFLFWNLTTDFYEVPKLIILAVITSVLLLLTSLRFVFEDKVTLNSTNLDIPLLIFLVIAIVSTVLSPTLMLSIFGTQPTPYGGLAFWIILILFYFVVANHLKGAKDAKFVITLLTLSGVVLSLVTLASYFGLKFLPAPWTQSVNFTPTGSSFTTSAILALLLPFSVLAIFSDHNSKIYGLTVKAIHAILLTLFGVTIALIGGLATWVGAGVGLGLSLLLVSYKNLLKNSAFIATPTVLVLLVAILSYLPPIAGMNNPLYTLSQNYPREIQLDFLTSWKVSVSAFRDSPFFGAGPDSYLYNFTSYKPIEFNNTKFWNIRFDIPHNEYLSFLASFGGLGLLALLILTSITIASALAILFTEKRIDPNTTSLTDKDLSMMGINLNPFVASTNQSLKIGLGIAGIVFFTILIFHSSTLPLWVIGILLLAAYMVSTTHLSRPIRLNIGNLTSQIEGLSVDTLPSIILVVTLVIVGAGAFFGTKYVLSDMHHRNALTAVSQNNGLLTYNELVEAERLSPWNDLYRTDLAQTNFALANAIALSKAPTEASPAGSLTDTDKANIQTLLSQAIAEGRSATELNPRSPINWEILAILYRQIAGVAQNALIFSLDSYGRAIQKDPFNPVLRLNVGGVYYAVANYDLAIRFFTDAVNLKPDYANAYYNLSVALKDKGDLQGAIVTAEKVLTLVDANSADYKAASDYLTELKNKQAAQTTPPAAGETGSALEKDELPNVLDLPKPEKIATPEAIKRSPSPSPSPTPTP